MEERRWGEEHFAYIVRRAPLKSGYSSHFIVVQLDGDVPRVTFDESSNVLLADEVVIGQESQVAPAFVLRISKDQSKRHLQKWMTKVDSQSRLTKSLSESSLSYVPLADPSASEGGVALEDGSSLL
jgi:hypothetical protein